MPPDLIALLGQYGPVLIFAITVIAAFGLPAPASMTLLASGALAAFGQIELGWVIAAGWAGAVCGDHLVRWVAQRASHRLAGGRLARSAARAEKFVHRWGVVGVFASRFILPTVLTPGVNYFCGISGYPLRLFTPAVILGEAVYVGGYVLLGHTFNTQLRQIERIALTSGLLILAIVAALACVVLLVRALRRRS